MMMSYFSAAWHSTTHSAPQMVVTVIQLVALSVAGQRVRANETSHTLWSLVSRGENQQPPTQDMISLLPPFHELVSRPETSAIQSGGATEVGVDGGHGTNDEFKLSVNVIISFDLF